MLKLSRHAADQTATHVVGHPSAPIGMGEHARSVYRALREAGDRPKLIDIYGPIEGHDRNLVATYAHDLSPMLGRGVNIFCINADEVEQAFGVLKDRNLKAAGSHNVIYPAWELERYPKEWGEILDQFDEVWAPSKFIAQSLSRATTRSVVHMPLACEVNERGLFSRKYFGIPDSAYCFFFAFDFLSYIERKNPLAVLQAFEQAVTERPSADTRLIIKVNNTHRKPEEFAKFREQFKAYRDKVVLVGDVLSDLEMKALMWLIDCFVSLHRSEGFGRGMSEAMHLGKPVIATAYSGNMDFCTADTALLTPYELIDVRPGEYPHWQGQVWADPDVRTAALHMVTLLDDRSVGESLGRRARAHLMAHFSFLRRGRAYLERCTELLAAR